ncbi:MAG: putative enzyme related to lactoylglutathione lyase [Candidatus Latescibacterota bacterium]|jgi:predicted enzyme related to lactoylglutathione lyase
MEYWMLMTGDDKEPGINGGLSPRDSGENSTIMNTIQVECVDTYIDKVKTSGARSPKKKNPSPASVIWPFAKTLRAIPLASSRWMKTPPQRVPNRR